MSDETQPAETEEERQRRLEEERQAQDEQLDEAAASGAETYEERAEGARANPNFRPDPTAMSGTLDTSGTSGGASERLENISPAFDVADAATLQSAAAANPDDEGLQQRAEEVTERAEAAGFVVPESPALDPEGTPMKDPADPGAVVETDEEGNVVYDESGQPKTTEGDVEGVNEHADENQ